MTEAGVKVWRARAAGLLAVAGLLAAQPVLARQSAAASDAIYYAAKQIVAVGGAGDQGSVSLLPLANCAFEIEAVRRSGGGAGDTVYKYRGSFRNAYLLKSSAGGANFIIIAPQGGPAVSYTFFNNYNERSDTAQVLPVLFSSEQAGATAMAAFNRVSAECGLPTVTQ